jgi:hypothetical protein
MILLAALIVAAAVLWLARVVAQEAHAAREDALRTRRMDVVRTFAAGMAAVQREPAALLTWQPLARTARQIFPEEFAALDQAAGRPFPFGREQLEAAHARCTTEWLTWERSHDAAFKLKAAEAEHDVSASGGSPIMKARLDAIEREKLDLYQRHYEAYIRTAKALQAFLDR